MRSLTEKYYYFWVMKTKHTFYFLLILTGALLMASGDFVFLREYSFSLGMVLLMFGGYKASQSWNHAGENGKEEREGGSR